MNAADGLRILLAEDNLFNQQITTLTLKKRGYAVEVAESGRQTIEKWMNGRYDLILMDLEMPDLDGWEATAAIRRMEEERGGHTPIFAVSAHPKSSHMDRCIAVGMDDYITKPINVEELGLKIRNMRAKTSPAADALPVEEPLFDLEPLRNMFTEEETRELTRLFLNRAGELVEDIGAALAREDSSSVRMKSHQLKGASSQFKINVLSKPAAQMEQMAEKGELAEAGLLFTNIKTVFGKVVTALEKEIRD